MDQNDIMIDWAIREALRKEEVAEAKKLKEGYNSNVRSTY